ncbi:MAG: tRNA (uridine(34)/cytosine(34)/5-carboxymethylaminomethyluridine(34)-2'-O)-methyltransferase TrmL [Clostridia bacterium]|nr:tRNA (uridine(34)/cytosine(34)/5-carboxymethylaminomethyluridine(34)-2'-O)-methyltransferase TrmL [Clostridia bacterium]
MFNIVLVEPEIPQNTGNIARTCAATGCKLHIVRPMGFEIDDKKLKRAGLDYWHLLGVKYYDNLDCFFEETKGGRYFYSTTKAIKTYTDVSFCEGDYILFGKETKGLPEELLHGNKDSCIRIPMIGEARSLNLSNAVAIVVYEALRQTGFVNLKEKGQLTKFEW